MESIVDVLADVGVPIGIRVLSHAVSFPPLKLADVVIVRGKPNFAVAMWDFGSSLVYKDSPEVSRAVREIYPFFSKAHLLRDVILRSRQWSVVLLILIGDRGKGREWLTVHIEV